MDVYTDSSKAWYGNCSGPGQFFADYEDRDSTVIRDVFGERSSSTYDALLSISSRYPCAGPSYLGRIRFC